MSEPYPEPEDLAADYFERELSEPETDALFEALNESADLRDTFMVTARDEWLLQHALHLQKTTAQPTLVHHDFRRRRIRRIAALIAIVLTLTGIFAAQFVHVDIGVRLASIKSQPVAEVVDFYVMERDVITVVNHGTLRELKTKTPLNDGDRIVVPPGARLTFRYLNEATTVAVTGNSLLSISDDHGAKVIRLHNGHLMADVDPQDPQAPMRVVTDDAEAVVLGTTFEISALDATHLAVHSGCVRLKSLLHNESVDVTAGHLINSLDMVEQGNVSFEQFELRPVLSKTLSDPALAHVQNSPATDWLLGVDADRGYTSFLTFDLGDLSDRIIEARLQLTVARKHQDPGGEGIFRLHRLSPSADPEQLSSFGRKVQAAYYQGMIDKNLRLEMVLGPAQLENGINTFELSLDEGGNDCWFAPSSSADGPRLILKVRKEGSGDS